MTRTTKDVIVTVLLAMAISQGPYLYYFTNGFLKLFALLIFLAVGGLITIILLLNLIIHRSTNNQYQIVGISFTILIGVFTSILPGMEFLDFNLRMSARQNIINQIKRGPVKSGDFEDNGILPLSNGGSIEYTKHSDGTVYVEFYVDRGFIDHYTSFVYTNNKEEMSSIQSGKNPFVSIAKPIGKNWYRLCY